MDLFGTIPAESRVLRFTPKGGRRCRLMPFKDTKVDKLVISAGKRLVNTETFSTMRERFEEAFHSEELAWNASVGVLRFTLVELAKYKEVQEVIQPLCNGLSPVSAEVLCKFVECAGKKCGKEIAAIRSLLKSTRVKDWANEESYRESIRGRDFEMEDPDDEGDAPEEHDDYDPVNGRFVNAEECQLQKELALAKSEKDMEKIAHIESQLYHLLVNESTFDNPIALFNLGVQCVNKEGNELRGLYLLKQAEQLGVRRATSFLYSYGGR